jgi:hypothetical protein
LGQFLIEGANTMENVFHSFSRFFKRAHPYTVAHYIGRKNAQRILGCKIKKKSKIYADQHVEEQNH